MRNMSYMVHLYYSFSVWETYLYRHSLYILSRNRLSNFTHNLISWVPEALTPLISTPLVTAATLHTHLTISIITSGLGEKHRGH